MTATESPHIAQPPQPTPPTPPRKRHRARWIIGGTVAILAIGLAVSATGSGGTPTAAPTATSQAAPPAPPAPTVAPTPEPPPAPAFTVEQQQAIDSAQGYLDMGDGFSKAGLIKQLHSPYGEGFSRSLARFAVAHVDVNWNEQAVLSAQGYVDMGDGFSYNGLVQQLHSPYGEGFTLAQAEHGATVALRS